MAIPKNQFPEILNPCNSAFFPEMPPSFNPDTTCSQFPYYNPDTKRILSGIANSIEPIFRANTGTCRKPVMVATSQVIGKFFAIQFLADSVINILTSEFAASQDGIFAPALLSGVTISKGTTLYLQIEKIQLVSGLAICYADPFRF